MIGFWIVVGCVVFCWLSIVVGVHDASPAAPFRAIADWFRQRRRIRVAAKLRKSWLACWPEVRGYMDFVREHKRELQPLGQLSASSREHIRKLRRDAKRIDWSWPPLSNVRAEPDLFKGENDWPKVKDYTGRLHELEEDGFKARSTSYESMREVFDAIDRDGHLIAACATASEHKVPPYEAFAVVPWWLEGSVFHTPRVCPTFVLNGSKQNYTRRAARVQRYMSSHTGRFSAWTGTMNDAACVDLEQPGLGRALAVQAPTHAASWEQMLGRLDRKKAPWYRRAWSKLTGRAMTVQSNTHGFSVGDGPLKIHDRPGEWFVTAVHGNELQLTRPNVIVRVWRWATKPLRSWWRARLFRREFQTYPRSGDDRVDALAYGTLVHVEIERRLRTRRWYHWFTKGARK